MSEAFPEVEYQTYIERLYYAKAREEGKTEGLEQGREQGQAQEASRIALRLLVRRCGMLGEALQGRIAALSLPQLEALTEALLDFQTLADLEAWLGEHAG